MKEETAYSGYGLLLVSLLILMLKTQHMPDLTPNAICQFIGLVGGVGVGVVVRVFLKI